MSGSENRKRRQFPRRLAVVALLAVCGVALPAQAAKRYPALVFVRENSLWIRESTGKERRLTRSFEDANPAVSPDGKLVVFERRPLGTHHAPGGNLIIPHPQSAGLGTELWLLDLRAEKERLLVRAPGDCFGPSFGPTGSSVYFQHVSDYAENGDSWREAIAAAVVSTGKWRDLPALVIPPGENDVEYSRAFPRITHDGKWLVWTTIPHEAGWAEIYRARPDGSGKTLVSRPHKGAGNIAWSFWLPTPHPRADVLVCLQTSMDKVGNSSSGVALIDLAGKTRWRKRDDTLDEFSSLSVTAEGIIALVRSEGQGEVDSIWALDPRSSRLTKLLSNASQPAWVPKAGK